jgi:hypothetical protein
MVFHTVARRLGSSRSLAGPQVNATRGSPWREFLQNLKKPRNPRVEALILDIGPQIKGWVRKLIRCNTKVIKQASELFVGLVSTEEFLLKVSTVSGLKVSTARGSELSGARFRGREKGRHSSGS